MYVNLSEPWSESNAVVPSKMLQNENADMKAADLATSATIC